MDPQYILALDAGTTSSRAILFDRHGAIVGTTQKEFPQIYPKPGWVEHDPQHIWESQYNVAEKVLIDHGVYPEEIAAIGITNQRETTLVWDKRTGEPVSNAIVWQDRRTAYICEELKSNGLEEYIRETTGLVVDAYFSGTKIAWILKNVDGCRKKAEAGDLVFGTVDTWLLWKLTGGTAHSTDVTNASRTMLFNIIEGCWDEKLLQTLDIPTSMMPIVKPSAHIYGKTDASIFDGVSIPIAGIAGDQQAALFGQTCFEPGMVKCTYGTGSFILMNTGDKPSRSQSGLITTIAWGLDDHITYAFEGSVFIAGAAIQWLRDEMGILQNAAESESLACQVEDTGGVYVVPAFTGLGAPYWDMYARGTIVGLTRGSGRSHIVRAVLESQAYQVRDVLACMADDSSIDLKELRVDGGASVNNFLMQFQADILGVPVSRPKIIETTARGAAFLAGLAVGFWKDQSELVRMNSIDRIFNPEMTESERSRLYGGWIRAVERAKGWEER